MTARLLALAILAALVLAWVYRPVVVTLFPDEPEALFI